MKKQKHISRKKFLMETLGTSMTPLLFPKLISSIFISADKSLLNLAEKYKLLQILHYLLSFSLSSLLFFLRFLPSLFASLIPSPPLDSPIKHHVNGNREVPPSSSSPPPPPIEGDSSIARALSQILSIMNEIPVSSRKYETVRSLAEKLIDENLIEACDSLTEVNRTALSAAFAKTLRQLESAMLGQERDRINQSPGGSVPLDHWLGRVSRTVRSFRGGQMLRLGGSKVEEVSRPVWLTADKLAAELLWLAQKLSACGNAEEAIWMWGSASNLAWLALSADPRLQGFLVKISAFLIKQVKDMGGDERRGGEDEENKREIQRQRTMELLMCWLPFLCQASNGSDAPVLSSIEKMEVERVLESIIQMLRQEDQQEKVLALWLHHFTSCPSSDWPNLQACYSRWCGLSRKSLAVR